MPSTINDGTRRDFYVYEHRRSDTGDVFWVGKGHGNRAWHMRWRNKYYKNIVAKLERNGEFVIVQLIRENLSEREALDYEIVRIAYWRKHGITLANLTDGGEGATGAKRTLEHRAIISATNRLRSPSAEARKRLSEARKGRSLSPETIAKITAAQHNRPPEKQAEISAKISAANTGRKYPPEVGAKISASKKGWNPSPETRARMSAAAKNRSPEGRANIAAANRNPEKIEKIAAKHRGQKRSEVARANIAAANTPDKIERTAAKNRGQNRSAETRANISAAMKRSHARRRELA